MHAQVRLVHRPLVRLQYLIDRLAETYDDALAFVLGDLLVGCPAIGANAQLVHDVGAEGH